MSYRVVYVSVQPSGTVCPPGSSTVQPATSANLNNLGFYKSDPSNVEPDWGLIIGTPILYLYQ